MQPPCNTRIAELLVFQYFIHSDPVRWFSVRSIIMIFKMFFSSTIFQIPLFCSCKFFCCPAFSCIHRKTSETVIFIVFIFNVKSVFLSLFIAHQHTDVRYWYSNSDCLSVYPSLPVSDENGLTYIVTVFSPYGSTIILVLSASNIFTKFLRVIPCEGTKYRWGIKISSFSTNKSLYLADDTR